MKKILLAITPLLFFACATHQEKVCVLDTNLGTMVFTFFEEDAPETSAYFQQKVNEGFYDGREFYRVVKGHVIQSGDGEGTESPTVKAEFNENPHIVGTVGMARDEDPDSGSTEFYICLAPRPHLDGKYTVFGRLVEGYDVLQKVGNVEVDENFIGESKIAFHKPKKPVVIEKATIEKRSVDVDSNNGK